MADEAIENVKEIVIRPAIQKRLEMLVAQEYSGHIVHFRSQVDEMMVQSPRGTEKSNDKIIDT